MKTEAVDPGGTARKLKAASRSFQRTLSEVVEGQRQLQKVEMHVTAQAFGGGSPKTECVIVVVSGDSAEAEKHCKEMTEQGCKCFRLAFVCTCDCGDVEEPEP